MSGSAFVFMPTPHLINYEHETQRVVIHVVTGPALAADDEADVHIRRETDTYQFRTWQSAKHGNMVGAEVLLKDAFYGLEAPPKTLHEDLKWFGLEAGVRDLEQINVWWVVMAASSIWAPDPEDDGDGGYVEDN